ncbi:MAG TPA: hypothetical protein VGQ00_01125 [Candidatus Norongarragalinales archaeon]|jgi:hypothetical protein|nr:hypothetical protein [Candidatus Norongarragalinales archaeon]
MASLYHWLAKKKAQRIASETVKDLLEKGRAATGFEFGSFTKSWKPILTKKHQGFTRVSTMRVLEKGIIAGAKDLASFRLAYYPKNIDEARAFAAGALRVAGGGPAQAYPGAVGSLYGAEKNDHTYAIGYVQGHFLLQRTPELSRKIVTKHGGWRHHLLNHAFKLIQENKSISRIQLSMSQTTPETMKIFKQVAAKHGFNKFVHRKSEWREHVFAEKT